MDTQVCDAARRGDFAAMRSLTEQQGKDVGEKDEVNIYCYGVIFDPNPL